MNTNSNVINLN
jgi:hypothetical protein